MQNLPVENLLRPAVEIWPAITSAAVAAAMALAPDAMMLPPDVGLVGAALFGAWALKRGLDARRVLRYRRNLRRLEHYALRPEQIPVSKHKLLVFLIMLKVFIMIVNMVLKFHLKKPLKINYSMLNLLVKRNSKNMI